MVSVQGVDVILTIETPIHDQLYYTEAKDIEVCQEVLNRFHIWYVSSKLPVVKWKIGFLAED